MSQPPNPGIVINNVRILRVDEVILLGHYMFEDIYNFNTTKCVSDNYYIRNVLFHKNCIVFYGSQVLPMFEDCMQELYTAGRIAVCRVW